MPHEDIYKEVKLVDKVNHDSDFYKKNEAEFQFSFTFPIVRNLNDRKWDIMVAYTHHAWWQVYNSDWSRPFRETNYTPISIQFWIACREFSGALRQSAR
jgi:phospholipase A1